MKGKLEVYIWHRFLGGTIIAVATSIEEARKMLRKDMLSLSRCELKEKPAIYSPPCGFFLDGDVQW